MKEVEFTGPYVCSEHFCDSCGDCMYCFGEDECPYLGTHACFVEVKE